MHRVRSVLLWWSALTALWLLYGGVYATEELVAGLTAGLVGALAAEVVRSLGLLAYRTDGSVVAEARSVPPKVLSELRDLVAALPTRGGAYRATPFDGGGATDRGSFRRAWAGVVGTLTPKAVVVDVGRDATLVHDIRPARPSDEPL